MGKLLFPLDLVNYVAFFIKSSKCSLSYSIIATDNIYEKMRNGTEFNKAYKRVIWKSRL